MASRRHIGGAGDLLAVRRRNGAQQVALIEVKSTTTPYNHFPPADRVAMTEAAASIGADAYLYWWPAGTGHPVVYHQSVWP